MKNPDRVRRILQRLTLPVAAEEMNVPGGEPKFIAVALSHIARARGMAQVAEDAISAQGDPRLSTLLGAAKALGLRISFSEAA